MGVRFFLSNIIKLWGGAKFYKKTRCFSETQMPPIKANSKDALGHKYTYLDASRKILSQEMLMCNMEAKIFII